MTVTTPMLAIAWQPWSSALTNGIDSILSLAEEWLGDYGLGIIPDQTSPPDAWAQLAAEVNGDRYAFRFDSSGCTKSIVAIVTIDEDPPARCVRVEIVRGVP